MKDSGTAANSLQMSKEKGSSAYDVCRKGNAPLPADLGVAWARADQTVEDWTPPMVAFYHPWWLVREYIVDVIERFDPGLHEFREIEMRFGSYWTVEPSQERWFVLHVTHKKRTIKMYEGIKGRWFSEFPEDISFKIGSSGALVHSGEALEGAHLWREEVANGWLFLSDQLCAALVEAGQPIETFGENSSVRLG